MAPLSPEFDARIAAIKDANEERRREERKQLIPELSEAAILAMAIYSAVECAS